MSARYDANGISFGWQYMSHGANRHQAFFVPMYIHRRNNFASHGTAGLSLQTPSSNELSLRQNASGNTST